MGILLNLIVTVSIIFLHNLPDVASQSEIVLTLPEHLEQYGFKCYLYYLVYIPVDCTFKLAPTAADLPPDFPSRMRALNDTNLLYIDHERVIPVFWSILIAAPFNFNKSVKFEAEVYYSLEGLLNAHLYYGPLKGDDWMWFPGQDQSSYRWLNLTSGHRYIYADDMNSNLVGFSFGSLDYGVYKQFKITLDEEVDPLPGDVHLIINNATEWAASGLNCDYDECKVEDALTSHDLPDNLFSPDFKALLANETNLMYFSSRFGFGPMEFLHRVDDLYKAASVQFFVEFFPDPNDPDVETEHVQCGRDIDYRWTSLFNVGQEVDVGWRKVQRKIPIAQLTRDYKLGFKLRKDFRAVYRKFEIILRI